MTRMSFSLLAMFLFVTVLPAPVWCAENQAPRPHIVYFLVDDLGWKDVGYHGSEIKTPNLDRLANGGVRLDQFYVQQVCSPTRASCMTGRYPIRTGLQVGVIRPWADYGLPLEERTLATALQGVGYYTAITGKWHLGNCDVAYLPTHRGFDHQYGHYVGAMDYFTKIRMEGYDWHRNDRTLREEGYTTNLIAAECQKIIEQHDPKQPLFLYVPFQAVHAPLEAPESYLQQYATIQDKQRRTYAAMTTCMDDAVGQILKALERRGMRDRTLVLFSSDNGGPEGLGADNGPLRGQKGTLYEGGVRVPACANWPGTLPAGVVRNGLMHMVDWYPTLAALAGASLNQPLPLDGKNMWDMIASGRSSPRTEVLNNLEPTRAAIRVGDWKLVRHTRQPNAGAKKSKRQKGKQKEKQKTGRTGTQIELFDLAKDPYETTNLADSQPEKVRELLDRLKVYAAGSAPPKQTPMPKGFKAPAVWGGDR